MNRDSTLARSAPPTARGQRTRAGLLEAAEAVFGEVGYEAASIAAITQRAEVALGTFYVYFPDKRSLFVEVVDELSRRLRRTIAQAVEGKTHRLEIEREGFRAFFEFASEHRTLYRIVRQAEFVDEGCYRRYYRRLATGYARGLAQAMDRNEVRKMAPESLAYCLMGIADMLGMRWVLWRDEKELDRVLETAMAFIEHGLTLDGEGAAAPASPRRRK